MLVQLYLGLTGVTAVWLTQSPNAETRRWACVFGLLSQPAWYWATWHAQQWGIFALCTVYTASWMRGFINVWVRPWMGKA